MFHLQVFVPWLLALAVVIGVARLGTLVARLVRALPRRNEDMVLTEGPST